MIIRHKLVRFQLPVLSAALCGMALVCGAEPVLPEQVEARARGWMANHPVMAAAASRGIKAVSEFPPDTPAACVYVVELEPGGYLVMNCDDRLDPVLAFDDKSTVNLADLPDNAFRAFLVRYVAELPAKLEALPARAPFVAMDVQALQTYGPYLTTFWNQTHPYNLYAPAGGSMNGYNGRVPIGCVPVATSQVLYYHRWPYRASGVVTNIDNRDALWGTFVADFSDPFNWSEMGNSYDSTTTSPQPGEDAVARLLYKMAVALQANFEGGATGASLSIPGALADRLYYEHVSYHNSASSAFFSEAQADLMEGFPCLVGIPGHAVVADGLITGGGSDSYHICYGWGGQNDGWWTASNINGKTIDHGATGLRPLLVAFPEEQVATAASGGPATLHWILPQRRETEVAQINIKQLVQYSTPWNHNAEDFQDAQANGWDVVPAGHSGSAWFSNTAGASLVLALEFTPTSGSMLSFQYSALVHSRRFLVQVSTDGGASWLDIFASSIGTGVKLPWAQQNLPLGAYAGQAIKIRFANESSGSYYPSPNGGVWLDNISVGAAAWAKWETYAVDTALNSRRFSETKTLIDDCANFNGFQITTPSSTPIYSSEWTTVTADGATCFYKAPMEYTGRAFHLTSLQTITPQHNTDLILHWKRHITADLFKVYVSQNRNSFSSTPIASLGGTSGWTDTLIPLGAYAGQAIYVRLEYTGGNAYGTPDAGIWIDKISTRTTVNPELEAQPIHDTVITAPTAPGTYRFAATLTDLGGVEHGLADELALTVIAPFVFDVLPDGSARLVSYTGSAAKFVIPSIWEGRAVTAIAANAFASAPNLKTLIIPASVTTFEPSALASSSLLNVYLHGDAPAGSSLFGTGTPTVYFKIGATGFGSGTLAGRPALQWNPVVSNIAFDPVNGLTVQFSAHTNLSYVLEYATNLTQQTWTPISTNRPVSSAAQTLDPSNGNEPARFYRIYALEPE